LPPGTYTTPTFKIFMATNHKPKRGGMDNAIWRRIRLIPFEAVFTEKDRDPRLADKLEQELPGILSWMLEGCLRWHREGLGSPPEVQAATDEYRQEMSAIETFLEEKCRRSDGAMVKASELYEAYKTWCDQNGEHGLSLRGFGGRLGETGLDKVRLTQGIHWLGLELQEK